MKQSDEQKPKFDPELEQRLYRWGCFLFELSNNRIGWAKQSPMVAALELGIFTPSFGSKAPFLNPDAMEIDSLVKVMHKAFPKNAEALLLYYYNTGEPLNVLAKPLDVSVRTLKARVHEAKVWLSGALAKIEDEEAAKIRRGHTDD